MESEIQSRVEKLDEIHNFVEETEKELLFVLQTYGWSSGHVKQQVSRRNECPVDPTHLVGNSKMVQHVQKCKKEFKQTDYGDKLFPDNCNRHPSTTVVIDAALSANIIDKVAVNDKTFNKGIQHNTVDNRQVPSSSNEMLSLFTTDERRAIYDYVVSKTSFAKNQFENVFEIQNNKYVKSQPSKTHLEELATLRDMKRRRTKYKVSTKAKSYTEIMREVIENQMRTDYYESQPTDFSDNKINSNSRNNTKLSDSYSKSKLYCKSGQDKKNKTDFHRKGKFPNE